MTQRETETGPTVEVVGCYQVSGTDGHRSTGTQTGESAAVNRAVGTCLWAVVEVLNLLVLVSDLTETGLNSIVTGVGR